MQTRRKLHRIPHLLVAAFVFSLTACATPAAPGSLQAIKQQQQRVLYKQCMHRNFMQAPPASALPLAYIDEQCRRWVKTKVS